MIIFKDILKQLADKGYTAYRLQREKQLSNGTIMQIRAGKPITTKTIDTLCQLLDCQPNDIMEYSDRDQDKT